MGILGKESSRILGIASSSIACTPEDDEMLSLEAELETLPEPVRPVEEDPEALAVETFGEVDEPETLGEVKLELEDETPEEDDVFRVDL